MLDARDVAPAAGGAAITPVQIAILAICLTLMASLAILVYRTPLGTAMRATAQPVSRAAAAASRAAHGSWKT